MGKHVSVDAEGLEEIKDNLARMIMGWISFGWLLEHGDSNCPQCMGTAMLYSILGMPQDTSTIPATMCLEARMHFAASQRAKQIVEKFTQ